jgi:D-alanyl-lipoteichoic acid acyltransferase DltB (MBOAT superfamily)
VSFNSIIFTLGFLPAAVIGYYLLALTPLHRLRLPFLILMAAIFYGRAQIVYLPLLIGSIVVNYGIAVMIERNASRPAAKRTWLTLGVVLDTGLLLGFKYLTAVMGALSGALGHANSLASIAAPLAISFYTFQQISFLVDVARGKVQLEGLLRYTAFVAFFPTLLAGPITLYSEIGPQLGIRPQRKGVAQNLLVGLIIFSLGLFKKTVLADTIGLWIDPIFTAAHAGHAPGFFLSWASAVGYTLQIYFDFSGYSDMAIGVGRMLGIVLPLNFFSPLRATSIIDIWRRWHMTLGRFVRDYIHQPLTIPLTRFASERGYGKWQQMWIAVFLPLFLSMVIIGTWHGPNWTYVIFGVLQGLYICTNEFYNALTRKRRRKKPDGPAAIFAYGLLTLAAFSISEIPFRADNVSDALHISSGLIGLNGLGLAENWTSFFSSSGEGLLLPMIAIGLLIVYFLPNTEQIVSIAHPALEWDKWRELYPPILSFNFRFSAFWVAFASFALFLGFAFISRGTTKFIYFNF